jgi:hypothetical protein
MFIAISLQEWQGRQENIPYRSNPFQEFSSCSENGTAPPQPTRAFGAMKYYSPLGTTIYLSPDPENVRNLLLRRQFSPKWKG